MSFENVIYSKEKRIARITINRPEKRNALNQAVRMELQQALRDIEEDDSIRVAIVTGAGDKAFIGGADITELKEMTPIACEARASTLGQQLYTDIENLRVPVVAMINGFCLGGGCELAMCCDIRVASENARLGQPEINIGIFPGGGGTQRLPRLVGWGKAKELLYTGRIIDAAEAERIGLVDKLVPADELDSTVTELAETIASKSPVIIRLLKKAITRGMYTNLPDGLAYDKSTFSLCFATEDHYEGITAFLEKRQPEFKGK
ncbi:MAG: enoyl-CoA hydratase/isomerase family protein [Dehalococcoidia bacterium]|nr:enoyl-CoA hydratase/isomerase family protein [Dehalococcoidia bacterium]